MSFQPTFYVLLGRLLQCLEYIHTSGPYAMINLQESAYVQVNVAIHIAQKQPLPLAIQQLFNVQAAGQNKP